MRLAIQRETILEALWDAVIPREAMTTSLQVIRLSSSSENQERISSVRKHMSSALTSVFKLAPKSVNDEGGVTVEIFKLFHTQRRATPASRRGNCCRQGKHKEGKHYEEDDDDDNDDDECDDGDDDECDDGDDDECDYGDGDEDNDDCDDDDDDDNNDNVDVMTLLWIMAAF
ncbi:hypothetical protein PoB_000760000 [Plakobranchus ocellatus]|uniref:Uncharacterized protein n=1 Tax=Plakobranchus ocellatus TaxID=259542 RepID=A0AAV3YDH7_9GAST|nr:hypothetical protein PoB_000760000 [Plakobranchus ocellatus]